MLAIERYAEGPHYPTLSTWWLGHGQEPEPAAALPGDARPGAGFVAYAADRPLAMAFVYATGTAVWLGPHVLTVDPWLREEEGGKHIASLAQDAVIQAVIRHVAGAGGGVLWTYTSDPAVVARGRRNGLRLLGRHPLLGMHVAPIAPGGA